MTLSDIGSLGELIGAIATVATLLYLAIQIRETTSWNKRQALGSVIDRFTTWMHRVRDNPEIMDLYVRGMTEYESFNQTEKHRYNFTMIEIMAAVETIFEHSKSDAIKLGAKQAGESWIRRALQSQGAQVWWQEMGKDVFAGDFVEAVDNVLGNTEAPKRGVDNGAN